MLDELCQDYHYERKYAIKLLRGTLPSPSGRKRPGPDSKYAAIEPIVRTIWLAAEQPCDNPRSFPARCAGNCGIGLRAWIPSR